MIIAADAMEKAIQLNPNILRLFFINLNPMAKIIIVTNARTADIPTIAIQYNISKNCATVISTSLFLLI
jgi:hypothetical protein